MPEDQAWREGYIVQQDDGNKEATGDGGFGWASERRAPPVDEGSLAPAVQDEGAKLRPSGQLAPIRGRWSVGEEPAPAVPANAPPLQSRPTPLRLEPAAAARPTADEAPLQRRRPGDPRAHDDSRGTPQTDAAKLRLHELLIEELEHGALEGLAPHKQREGVIKAAKELLVQEGMQLGGASKDELLDAVADEVLGLGPLEPLLRDPAVTEVMVNDLDRIFYEQEGRVFRSPARFRDRQHVMRIIERIVAPLGRRIDEASPMVDARLPDGSRVNITIPPVSPMAATITIRKFRADKMRMADLIAAGSMSEATAEFLAMCVRAKLNVIISGGTGTGKTTLLNALSAFIPNTERIITIEDPAELRLQQDHVITLEARPPSMEGKNQVHQRDLVRNSLRMRPDRIIVGEVRGSECFDMLQAMNTGHEGSISTVHANTPRDAIARLENMVLMAGMELPAKAIREQICSAIDVFIQVARLQDGSRKVSHVTEVSGMEGDTITLQDVFVFKLERVDDDGHVRGSMQPTGIRPGFADKFAMAGIEFPNHLFGDGLGW
ncbi:MAG: CpaF family protein [Tepidiformaceae bacterium]